MRVSSCACVFVCMCVWRPENRLTARASRAWELGECKVTPRAARPPETKPDPRSTKQRRGSGFMSEAPPRLCLIPLRACRATEGGSRTSRDQTKFPEGKMPGAELGANRLLQGSASALTTSRLRTPPRAQERTPGCELGDRSADSTQFGPLSPEVVPCGAGPCWTRERERPSLFKIWGKKY